MTNAPENRDTNSPVWEGVQSVRLATGNKLDHLSDDGVETLLRTCARGWHLRDTHPVEIATAGMGLVHSELLTIMQQAVHTYPTAIVPKSAILFDINLKEN